MVKWEIQMMTELLAFFLMPIKHTLAHYFLGGMGVFIILICIYMALPMDRGDRLCRVLKYGFTCACGFLAVAFALARLTIPVMLISTFAVALFLWPTVLYFFRGEYRNRIGDR
jgi:hypothetical protein